MEPTRIAFTKASVNAVPVPARGRVYVYDSKVSGLAVCVTNRGARTYYWLGRLSGKYERVRLGLTEKTTVEAARDAATAINAQQAMGRDASAVRSSARKEHKLGELWAVYLEQHAKPNKRSWKRDEATWERDLSPWKGRRLGAIESSEIQTLMTRLFNDHGPGAANKALDLLSSMYAFARMPQKWVKESPTDGLQRFKIASRERYLKESELEAFFAALASLQRQTARDFFLMALLTGARRANVSAMRWDEIDFDAATWRIPHGKHKSKTASTIALVPEAVALLQGRANDSPWVFPGRSTAGHYSEPKDAWRRLCTAAKLEDLRIHDLRRTLGSWQALAGSSLQVIAKSLGHLSTSSTGVYARLQLDPVRASVEQATAAILAAGKSKKS